MLDERSRALFDERFSAREVIENISVSTGVEIVAGTTLVIIDEIQEQPRALSLIKAFKEEMPELHIASAGSYLGVAYHAGQSFPVGKVDMIDMFPMTYLEFVRATGNARLAQWVEQLEFERLEPFEDALERLLRQYYYVGGMPEVIGAFLGSDGKASDNTTSGGDSSDSGVHGVENYRAARSVQHGLLQAYDRDFSKHQVKGIDPERVRLAFRSIPGHLSRENHKFMFGHIAKGARSSQYDTAIQFIVDSGLATRVHRLRKIALPLRGYEDASAFKLYMPDIGLLGAAMDIDVDELLLSNEGLDEYKGAMTEQYVCQQLVAAGQDPFYWSASDSRSEIDFVVKYHGAPAPIEVKAEENVHAKSLRTVCSQTGLHGFRSSMRGFREQNWLTNVPLWAVGAYFAPTA